MGRDSNMTCKTCKKNYYLGYNSYSGWIYASTLAEYDAKPDDLKKRRGNQNLRQVLEEHEGHEMFGPWSHDYMFNNRGVLEMNSGYHDDKVIEDYGDYEQINMHEEED